MKENYDEGYSHLVMSSLFDLVTTHISEIRPLVFFARRVLIFSLVKDTLNTMILGYDCLFVLFFVHN